MARKLTRTPAQTLKANGLGGMAHTVTRILAVWERATVADREAGAAWYGAESASVLASLCALGAPTPAHAAAVVAQLSPRTSWSRNVAGAVALVGQGPDAARALGCMRANVDRAVVALAAADPLSTVKGPKTGSFARNLLGDRNAVTVDVWAARVAMGDCVPNPETVLDRAGVYGAIADAYRAAALQAGVSPETMQATTWVVARNGRAK